MVLITEKMKEMVTEQIKHEMESAYIYLDMSTWLKVNSFPNLANWFYEQAKEEWEHAEKFIDHLIETGADVDYKTIKPPTEQWTGIEQILEGAYEHEKFITTKINNMYDAAQEHNDRAIIKLLLWFIEEQIEEENSAEELITLYKRYKNDQLFDNHVVRK